MMSASQSQASCPLSFLGSLVRRPNFRRFSIVLLSIFSPLTSSAGTPSPSTTSFTLSLVVTSASWSRYECSLMYSSVVSTFLSAPGMPLSTMSW